MMVHTSDIDRWYLYSLYLFGMLPYFINDIVISAVDSFCFGRISPQHFHTKTKMGYWPGDSADSNIDEDSEHMRLSSQRVQSVLDYIDPPDFSRTILTGCVNVFAVYLRIFPYYALI